MVLGVVGTTLVTGVVLVEIAAASGAEVDLVLGASLPSALALLGGLAFLIVGDVVFGAGSFAGSAATIFEIIGALITCAALMWLGLSLLSGSGTSAGQPARAS
jgi:hypothetical protein